MPAGGTGLVLRGLRKEPAAIGKWHLGWDWTHKEGKAKTVDNIGFTKRVANGPTDRGFDYFYGLTSPSGPPYLYMVNDMAEKQPNTRFEESGGGLYKIKGGIGHSDWSADGMQPHLADKMLEYLDENKDSDKPFFLYMALTAPHIPLFPSKEFKGKSKIGDYGDLVMMIDDIVGRVNRKLKEIGKYDNTIVMFAADNGCAGYINMDRINRKGHYPSYIYRGYKSHGWEGGHRIPFILSWGDRYGHVTDNSLVSLTDLYATFADMLGYRIADDEAEDSFSFWPIRRPDRPDRHVGSRLFHLPDTAVQADIQRGKRFRRRVQDRRTAPAAILRHGQRSRREGQPDKQSGIRGPDQGDGRPGEEVHRGRPIDARSQSGQRRRQFLETDHRHNERPVRREQVRAKLRRRMPEPPSGSDQKTSAFRNRNTEVFNWRQRAGAGHARRYRRAG